MKYETLAAVGFDVMALGNVALAVCGLGMTAVGIKVARATLKANLTAVELAAGSVGSEVLEPKIVGEELHVCNHSLLRVTLHHLFLGSSSDVESPREDFVAAAHPLPARCHVLEANETAKFALSADHLERLHTQEKGSAVGMDWALFEGEKSLRWGAKPLTLGNSEAA